MRSGYSKGLASVISIKSYSPAYLTASSGEFVSRLCAAYEKRYPGEKFYDLQPALRYKAVSGLIQRCSLCPIRQEAIRPTPPSGNCLSPVVFVGRNPGKQEDSTGIPFYPGAPIGFIFKKYLEILEVDRDAVYITNTLKCHTLNDRPPSDDECSLCIPWLRVEMDYLVNASVIFMVGNDALRSFLGYSIQIMGVWGNVYIGNTESGDKVVLVPLLHPGQVRRNRSLMVEVERLLLYIKPFVRKVMDRDGRQTR